ncbi:MAG: HD-GYP domain-containing protein [Chloroflexi bacterium]|nr:HD-GYP domain-containing protein [Chloroflexota bacterium]
MIKEREEAMTDYSYVPLELEGIRAVLPLMCDLYIEEGGRYILYRSTSLPFTALDCERLMAAGVTCLWIRGAGGMSTQHPATALLSLPDEQVPPMVKAKVLYDSAMETVRQAASNTALQAVIPRVADLVGLTLRYLTHSSNAFGALLTVMRHDYSVYTHAVNVGFYAVGVGKAIGITDNRELAVLGMGAFLHDVGKSNVPNNVLSKPGALSVDEWATIRKHPSWGRATLSGAVDISPVVLDIVSQHHERLDGSGYPAGIKGDSMHLYAKLVAVVDSFDAMTSERPYRPAHSPYNALKILKGESTGKLDPKLFAALVRLLRNLSEPATS